MAVDEMDKHSEKTRLIRLQWKRFSVYGLCYFSIYTAFRGLRDLQSTLNNAEGMGLASLSVLNVCSAIASLFVPAIIRLKLGTKWSMVLGTVLYTLYTASNYYANVYLLLSAAVLPGIGTAFLAISRGTYITILAMELAAAHGRNPAADIAMLNSIFLSVSRLSTICGNMISALVFQTGLQSSVDKNISIDHGSCGIRACGGDSIGNSTSALAPPDQSSRNVLVSIYLGFGVVAVVIALVFLERVPPKTSPRTNGEEAASLTTKEVMHSMMSVLRLMRHPRMIMLIPALFYNGVDMAFTSGHFTKFFVGCTQGIESVGIVGMSLYITATLCSPIIGRLIKYTGRVPIFIAGCAVYLLLLIVMMLWDPEGSRLWHLCIMASGLGISRAILPIVSLTVLGLLFPDQKEAAFGNMCFWQSIGFAAVFALGVPQSVCAVHVISITMAMLLIVLVMYLALEFRIMKDRPPSHERIEYVSANGDSGRLKEEDVDLALSPVKGT